MKAKDLAQVRDSGAMAAFAAQAIAANPKVVVDFRNGKQAALMYRIGPVMELGRGKLAP